LTSSNGVATAQSHGAKREIVNYIICAASAIIIAASAGDVLRVITTFDQARKKLRIALVKCAALFGQSPSFWIRSWP
jgi:hypothetical protein